MDRLEQNYFFEGNYYTWNRISARNATPKYWDAPQFDFYVDQNNQRKNTLFGNFGLNYEINDNLTFCLEAEDIKWHLGNHGINDFDEYSLKDK